MALFVTYSDGHERNATLKGLPSLESDILRTGKTVRLRHPHLGQLQGHQVEAVSPIWKGVPLGNVCSRTGEKRLWAEQKDLSKTS